MSYLVIEPARNLLNGVLAMRPGHLHFRDGRAVVLPATIHVAFVTGGAGVRARKHLPAHAFTAWDHGEFVALGVVYACGERTSKPRDAATLDDDRLCDACVLADLGPVVYRFYGEGVQPLYIGCTVSPLTRLAQHERNAAWWPLVKDVRLEHFPTHDEALAAEAAAILAEQPCFNQRGLTLVASA